MISADQLFAHVAGDYLLQSHWMATEKTKHHTAAAAHAIAYGLPFLVAFYPSWLALLVIVGSHFLIDRYRLARYVVWLKNGLSPKGLERWDDCTGTGYHKDVPPWLSVWLLIAADNAIHVAINGLALAYL